MKIVCVLFRFVAVVLESQFRETKELAVATVMVQQKKEPTGTVMFDAGENVGAVSCVAPAREASVKLKLGMLAMVVTVVQVDAEL